ncbi:hypothetical protein GP486_007834 [Trichoglossum hirsutum]|uniref:Ima1 N-terminal domain-containing protein n=1 Tax=Trichoglossum hirsutum TaxID=265104 RepID=A0A9P8IF39_9PEZI|nr:hypothetical protein GP486_007834 [Trichoglossum hirsutum]
MVPLLRKGLVCFYCGCRSKQKQDGKVRQWLCKNCDAVNYLDENGEIADHVPPSPADKIRYADPRPASTKPKPHSFPSSGDDNKPFCPTCLKNQHLFTQALASYLPSPTDPRYPAYEASYPEYRQKLEQRYPQVCAECEEGVVKQIRQAEYMANTEYLRRKIEATRNGARKTLAQSWGWRRILIFTGGVTWILSLSLQGLWHLHAAKAQQIPDGGLIGDMSDITPKRFLRSCVLLKDDMDCLSLTAYLVRVSLAMAVGSIWWNNQLWKKTLGTWARLAGLADYYRLQLVILLVRTTAWWILRHDVVMRPKKEALRAAHLFLLAFIILSTIVSLRIVKVSTEPRVSFRRTAERPVPRLEKKPQAVSSATAPAPIYPTPPNSQTTILQSLPSPPLPHPERPPSPASDVDEMDWTPSQEQVHFNTNLPPNATISVTGTPQAPSPFYGRLPTQPISPAARLRNPPNQPHLRKITDDQKDLLINNMRGSLSSGNEDADGSLGKDIKQSITLANPRFFPDDDYNRDTGLESLFDTVFTLGDEPPEVAKAIKSQQRQAGPMSSGPRPTAGTGITKSEKFWKEWVVPAILAVPVIFGIHWVVVGIWGVVNKIIGE